MLRLLLLVYALATAQVAENLECEVELVTGDQILDDPASRLLVTAESLPLTTKFPEDATDLLQRYQIRIQTAQFRLSAFNANNQSVGTPKSYADLAEAGCIALGVGQSPDCVGILGCDGFVLGVVKTLQQFPQTARYFAFNFTYFIIDPETTQMRGFWLWKTEEKVGATIVQVSESQIMLWQPSDALRAQAFPDSVASSDDDDVWKMWVYILGSVLGTLLVVILVYIACLARRESLEEQHHHHGATQEETKPLMPPPKPTYEMKGQVETKGETDEGDSSGQTSLFGFKMRPGAGQPHWRARTAPAYVLAGKEPPRV
jgi:hypothetical protein